VRSGIGSEGELEFLCRFADAVEDDAGLDVDGASDGINGTHFVHVLREVEDDGGVGALTCERGTGSASEDGSVEAAADFYCGDDVFFIEGKDETDGDVAIVGGVGGVESAGTGVEADFAADFFAESGFELGGGGEGIAVTCVRAGQKDEG
jgi:hypothetical protein